MRKELNSLIERAEMAEQYTMEKAVDGGAQPAARLAVDMVNRPQAIPK